ncbi:MAG: TetR/AcrR family transcriptional regulator [Actinomycetes bacterium]
MLPNREMSGRPRRETFIEQARRAQMVQCAAEEIAEHGYAATSLVAIARRAGVSRGVISYHFADKDDLVEQLVTDFYADAAAFIAPRMLAQSGVRAQVSAFIEANLEFFAEHPIQVRAAMEIATHHRFATGARLDEVRPEPAAGRAGLIALLEQGQAGGELRQFDTRAMAVAMRHAIDGALTELARDPEFDFTTYARELVTTFDLALRAQP